MLKSLKVIEKDREFLKYFFATCCLFNLGGCHFLEILVVTILSSTQHVSHFHFPLVSQMTKRIL